MQQAFLAGQPQKKKVSHSISLHLNQTDWFSVNLQGAVTGRSVSYSPKGFLPITLTNMSLTCVPQQAWSPNLSAFVLYCCRLPARPRRVPGYRVYWIHHFEMQDKMQVFSLRSYSVCFFSPWMEYDRSWSVSLCFTVLIDSCHRVSV